MTENVGKIRIGCEVDSSGAKRGIDDLYKAIRLLSKSINSLLNSKSISIKLQLANNAESSLLSEVTKVTDNISKTAKITVDMEVNGEVVEKFNKGASSIADTLSESVNSTADVKAYLDVLDGLSYTVNNISYNDKASKFFKSLSGDIANFYTKTAPFIKSMDAYTIVLNNLAICVDDLSNAGNADQFFKNIKKYNDILSKVGFISSSIGMFGQSLNTLSNGVSALSNTGDVSDKLGSIKSTIGLLGKVNDIPVDAAKADAISSSLKSIGEGVSSLSTVSDISENLGYIKSTLSVINKLNETNVDSSQIAGIGTSVSALVNTISNIHVPKKADKILSLINSIKGILTVINAIGSADSNIDASKINSIGASLTALVNTITNINVSDRSANITELATSVKGIVSVFTAIGKIDTGSIDSAKIEAIATSISSLVSRLSSINIPENATQIVELANAIRTLNNASTGTSSNSKTTSLLDKLNSGASKALGVIGKLLGIFKNLHNKIKGVHTAADKMGNAIKKSYTELYSKIKLITGAIKTFINTFKNLDSAYSKQVSAETRLAVAMSNSTGATRGQIQEIKDLASEYQQLGILGDEVQLTGLQELSTYVESTESIKKLLPIMNDMTAQQFGFEATTENAFTIAMALGKVLNGNTDTLKRYGYAFNDAQKQILKYGTEEQKVAVLTEVVSSAVGGMNNAMANTPTGRITQLKNNFGDLKEAIGELLNYVILPFVKSINTVILRITQSVKSLTAFIKEALGIKTVTKEVKTLLDTSSNKTANSLDGVSDSLDDTAESADSTKKKVKNLLGSFDELNILSESTSSNLDDSSDALDSLSLGQGVTDTIEVPDLGDFKKRFSALFDSLDFEKLGLNFAEKINEYIDKWNPAASGAALADKLNKLIKFANTGLKNINFKQLGQKIGTWINSFVGKFDSKQLGNTIATLINQAVAFANGLLTETDFKKLGESIGTFISELFTDIDYIALADLIINAVEAAVNTAAGIISKIDFKGIGKGLAQGVNRLSRANSTWTKAAHVLSDAIVGILDLATTFLNETDFEALGYAIGNFISEIKWEDVLRAAGEALWAAFKAVLGFTKGVFDGNAIAGSIVALVEALVLFKGISGVTGIISGLTGALSGMSMLSLAGITAGLAVLATKLVEDWREKQVGQWLTDYLSEDIPAAEEDVKAATDKIGIDFDNIAGSATKNGFILDQETGKMIGYVDNMRIEIDKDTGEIKGYYERLKLGDLPEVFGSAIDSMSAKFSTDSVFVKNFIDSTNKVKDLQDEVAQIAPTIRTAGEDTDKAVDKLSDALDRLKEATKSSKESASNLLLAYVNNSQELLKQNGVDIEQVNKDIKDATDWSKELTDKQIARFKELAKSVSEGKTLTEAEAIEYNDLLDKMTGGNVKALQENKKELETYINAIKNGEIQFKNPEEAKAVIEEITAKYGEASKKLTEYSDYVNKAVDTLELPEDAKARYKEMFASMLTLEQTDLDTAFIKTKSAIGAEVKNLWEETKKQFGEPSANNFWRDTIEAANIKGSDFVGHLASGLNSAYNTDLLPKLKAVYNASKDTASDIKNTALESLENIQNKLTKSSKDIKDVSRKYGFNIKDGFFSGFTGSVNLNPAINKTPFWYSVDASNKSMDALNKNKNKAYDTSKDYGKNITQGLIDGQKSKEVELNKEADKIAKTPSNTIKSVNDINSPSKVLYKQGVYLMEGLINGLVSKQNELMNKSKSIANTFIDSLKLNNTMIDKLKNIGKSFMTYIISPMTLDNNDKIKIGNSIIGVYNAIIEKYNNLGGKLNTASNNFIHNITNPITNGLKLLLDSMDLFYTKFRNKWQGVANLFNNKFIAAAMGVTKVPNLNDNYYPFGNNIVKLAQGAVIKPNNEFMAILGDQKRGLNIETPLATMKQAFVEALNDGGYSGGNITIPVYIGNEKIDTLIVNSNNRRGMRNNGRV